MFIIDQNLRQNYSPCFIPYQTSDVRFGIFNSYLEI